jgi:hypothetical protein
MNDDEAPMQRLPVAGRIFAAFFLGFITNLGMGLRWGGWLIK